MAWQQSIGRLVTLIFMGVMLALVLAELGARALGSPAEWRDAERMLRCDRLVGWRGKANLATTITWQGNSHRVVRNSWGMHDNEHQQQKAEHVFRILMLGDSYLEAIEVEEQQTSHAVLEKILNNRAPPGASIEVINAGIHGWGPAQQLMYFRAEGNLFQPDLILVFWAPANDLYNVLPQQKLTVEGVNCYAPYFAMCQARFDPEPFFPVPGWQPTWQDCSAGGKFAANVLNRLYTHSRLFQRLSPLLVPLENDLAFSHRYAPWVKDETADERLTDAYRLTVAIYDRLAVEAEQIGANAVFIIVPFNQAVYSQVNPDYAAALKRDLPEFEQADPVLPNRIFAAAMQNQGRPVLDLHPYFVDYIRQYGQQLHWPGDIHWTAQGNQVVAEIVAQWLIEHEFIFKGD